MSVRYRAERTRAPQWSEQTSAISDPPQWLRTLDVIVIVEIVVDVRSTLRELGHRPMTRSCHPSSRRAGTESFMLWVVAFLISSLRLILPDICTHPAMFLEANPSIQVVSHRRGTEYGKTVSLAGFVEAPVCSRRMRFLDCASARIEGIGDCPLSDRTHHSSLPKFLFTSRKSPTSTRPFASTSQRGSALPIISQKRKKSA